MSTLEERIADVIRAIAFEFNRSKETTNSGIDTKTLNRIMRCVHAWEKTVDTDKDGVTDYDEYEVHKTDPDKKDTNKVEVPKGTNDTGVYDIRVKNFQVIENDISLAFELTENGSPVYMDNETTYTLKTYGEKLDVYFTGDVIYYYGRFRDPIDVSIEFKGVTTTRKFTYRGGTFVQDTRSK